MSAVFTTGNTDVELMRFEDNGDIFVRGEKVDSNPAVYAAFRSWLGDPRSPPTRCEAHVEATARIVFEDFHDEVDALADDDGFSNLHDPLRELNLALIALDVERTK